jgi:hypothetical protein
MATRRLIPLLALLVFAGACRQIPTDTIHGADGDVQQYAALKAQAADLFATDPRTPDSITRAAAYIDQAINLRVDDRDGLLLGARIAVWFGSYHPDEDAREAHIRRGLEYANTALEQWPDDPDAIYRRAVLAGLLADLSRSYGLDAMHTIERSMRRLIEAGHDVDHGGPWRVYGTLLMRAPGPPAGVGSMRNAGRNLRAAVEAAPDWPENHLYLAEWEITDGRARGNDESIRQGIQRLHTHLLSDKATAPAGHTTEFQHWQDLARKL